MIVTAMPIRTLAELRALVGAAGRDWTDAELLRAAEATRQHAGLIVSAWRDGLDPVGAQRRVQIGLLRDRTRLAPRRARYPRLRVRASGFEATRPSTRSAERVSAAHDGG